jgi:hypothetical protein
MNGYKWNMVARSKQSDGMRGAEQSRESVSEE